jgi:hypothetical protein
VVTMLGQSTGLLRWLCASVVFAASALSSIVTTRLSLWLLLGGSNGVFRSSFGENRQYLYFVIAIVAISLAITLATFYRERVVFLMGFGATGGYVGSVLAYYALSYEFVERMVRSGHFEFSVAPVVHPIHLFFVASGALAGAMVFVFLSVYKAWRSR